MQSTVHCIVVDFQMVGSLQFLSGCCYRKEYLNRPFEHLSQYPTLCTGISGFLVSENIQILLIRKSAVKLQMDAHLYSGKYSSGRSLFPFCMDVSVKTIY